MTGLEFLDLAVNISVGMVTAALVFAFIRLAIGPSLPDRVVALDMMTVLIVTFCGLFAVFASVPAFLDVALIVALVGFLATVALARYAERSSARDGAAEKRARTGAQTPTEARKSEGEA